MVAEFHCGLFCLLFVGELANNLFVMFNKTVMQIQLEFIYTCKDILHSATSPLILSGLQFPCCNFVFFTTSTQVGHKIHHTCITYSQC